jgi:hypothetical protein
MGKEEQTNASVRLPTEPYCPPILAHARVAPTELPPACASCYPFNRRCVVVFLSIFQFSISVHLSPSPSFAVFVRFVLPGVLDLLDDDLDIPHALFTSQPNKPNTHSLFLSKSFFLYALSVSAARRVDLAASLSSFIEPKKPNHPQQLTHNPFHHALQRPPLPRHRRSRCRVGQRQAGKSSVAAIAGRGNRASSVRERVWYVCGCFWAALVADACGCHR